VKRLFVGVVASEFNVHSVLSHGVLYGCQALRRQLGLVAGGLEINVRTWIRRVPFERFRGAVEVVGNIPQFCLHCFVGDARQQALHPLPKRSDCLASRLFWGGVWHGGDSNPERVFGFLSGSDADPRADEIRGNGIEFRYIEETA
jgi:hypothetical protein